MEAYYHTDVQAVPVTVVKVFVDSDQDSTPTDNSNPDLTLSQNPGYLLYGQLPRKLMSILL